MDGAGGWREVMHFFWLTQQGQLGWKSSTLGTFLCLFGTVCIPMTVTERRYEIFIIKGFFQEKKI